MDKDAYVFNASLFFKIGIKIYWEFGARHLTVRMFYSRAEIKIINWD